MTELQLENPNKKPSGFGRNLRRILMVAGIAAVIKFGIFDNLGNYKVINPNPYTTRDVRHFVDPGMPVPDEVGVQITEEIGSIDLPPVNGGFNLVNGQVPPSERYIDAFPRIDQEGFIIEEFNQVVHEVFTGNFTPEFRSVSEVGRLLDQLDTIYDKGYILDGDPEFTSRVIALDVIPLDIMPHLNPDQVESFESGEKNLYEIGLEKWKDGDTIVLRKLAMHMLWELQSQINAHPYDPNFILDETYEDDSPDLAYFQALVIDYENYRNRIMASEALYKHASHLLAIAAFLQLQSNRGMTLDSFQAFLDTEYGVVVLEDLSGIEIEVETLEALIEDLSQISSQEPGTERTEKTYSEVLNNMSIPDKNYNEVFSYLFYTLRNFMNRLGYVPYVDETLKVS